MRINTPICDSADANNFNAKNKDPKDPTLLEASLHNVTEEHYLNPATVVGLLLTKWSMKYQRGLHYVCFVSFAGQPKFLVSNRRNLHHALWSLIRPRHLLLTTVGFSSDVKQRAPHLASPEISRASHVACLHLGVFSLPQLYLDASCKPFASLPLSRRLTVCVCFTNPSRIRIYRWYSN